MTELLYMKDNYIREFDAKIVDVTEDSLILDRTAFYPEGGGQIGDKGFISTDSDRIEIISTKKREGRVQELYAV